MAACVVAAAAGVVAAAECLHSACPAGPADAAARYQAAMTSGAARPTPARARRAAGVRARMDSWRSDTPPPLRGSARTARQVPAAVGPAQAVGADGAVAESAN